MKQVAIVGFGRFGELLAGVLRGSFEVVVVESSRKRQQAARQQGYRVMQFSSLGKADCIFLAVPISEIAELLRRLGPVVNKGQTVIDVCSVKLFPAKLMGYHLPECQTLASHPLFGPDSAREGLKGHKMVICPVGASQDTVSFWKDFWSDRGVEVYHSTPEAHDRDMVYSLGLTQTLARLVDRMHMPELTLTTSSFDAVKRVADFSLQDTDQLYHDMLYYNPFFQAMRERLVKAYSETAKQLDQIAKEQEEAKRAAQQKSSQPRP